MILRRAVLPLIAAVFAVCVADDIAAAQDVIDLPGTGSALEYDADTESFLIEVRRSESLGPCSRHELIVTDVDGTLRWRAPVAPCEWTVHDGLVIISSWDTISAFDLVTGALVRSWQMPADTRALEVFGADRTLYFNREHIVNGNWASDGVGSVLLDVDDDVGTGAFGTDHLVAISSDGRFLWLRNAATLTRFDRAGQTDEIVMPSYEVGYGDRSFHLTADESRLYIGQGGATLVDALTLEVIDIAPTGGPNPRSFVELPDGRILGVDDSRRPGPTNAYAIDTVDIIATGPNVGPFFDDVAVVGDRLAVLVGSSVEFHDASPALQGLRYGQLELDADNPRTARFDVHWIDAIESISVAGQELSFAGVDLDRDGRIDVLDIDLPGLGEGRHLLRFDGPLGPSTDASHNEIEVGPAVPRSEFEIVVRSDSRAGEVLVSATCQSPTASERDEPSDIDFEETAQAGDRFTLRPRIGDRCTVGSSRGPDDSLPPGYEQHLTAGFFDPRLDASGLDVFDLDGPFRQFDVTDEPVGYSVFLPDTDETVLWLLAYGFGHDYGSARSIEIDCPGTDRDQTIDQIYYGYWTRLVLPSRYCLLTHPDPADTYFSGWGDYVIETREAREPNTNDSRYFSGLGSPVEALVLWDLYPHPADHNGAFVRQQYQDFLGRDGDAGGIAHWTRALDDGTRSRTGLVELFIESPEFGGTAAPVNRLYRAYFDRAPDRDGLLFWMGWIRSGRTLAEASDEFARSAEFARTYGALDDAAFVDLVYRNVLGRSPDAAGRAYWVARLGDGLSRGELMLGFSESAEYRSQTASAVLVESLYQGLLQRSPDPQGFDYWTAQADAGASLEHLIAGMLSSDEYYDRFVLIVDDLPGIGANLALQVDGPPLTPS